MDWAMDLAALMDREWQRPVISQQEYMEFQRYWLMYFIAGKRYGESFCEHFKLGSATPLYHFKDEAISKRWINDNYLEK